MRKGMLALCLLLLAPLVWAQTGVPPQGSLTLTLPQTGLTPTGGELANTLKIALLMTLLALLPAILMMMTSFTRIIISFHFLRQAMGLQGVPPNQVLLGMSLFLTLFVMSPVLMDIQKTALEPLSKGEITEMQALDRAVVPIRHFMLTQTRQADLALFTRMSGAPMPQNRDDVRMLTLIPAFVLSELKTAFQIGFLLYIPFLIIDTVVAAILVAMGMIFLPPMMISMPFKIVLFILADGWTLLMGSLVRSFHTGGG